MSYNIQNIRETQFILLENTDMGFKRYLYSQIDFKQRLIGIAGPRGVGKTTMILQYLKENHANSDKAIYFLADNVLFSDGDLFEFAREFYLKRGGRLICIDEIHRYKNWNQELKNIYDAFPDLKIIFSGSSSLDLVRGKYDLSRRGVMYRLPGLSFREYLELKEKISHKSFGFGALLKNYERISRDIARTADILKYFNEYLAAGYYPFWLETKDNRLYYQQVSNTVDKAIYEDIASFYSLKTENLIVFKKILLFLATISPGKFSINKLASSLGKNHATISEYLNILGEAGLVRFLSNSKTGHSLVRHASKVFLDNTNLAAAIAEFSGKEIDIGAKRELFVLNQLQNSGLIPMHTPMGDLRVEKYVFEIGGRNKDATQIKNVKNSFLLLDDIIVSGNGQIPLYLLGFLY